MWRLWLPLLCSTPHSLHDPGTNGYSNAVRKNIHAVGNSTSTDCSTSSDNPADTHNNSASTSSDPKYHCSASSSSKNNYAFSTVYSYDAASIPNGHGSSISDDHGSSSSIPSYLTATTAYGDASTSSSYITCSIPNDHWPTETNLANAVTSHNWSSSTHITNAVSSNNWSS